MRITYDDNKRRDTLRERGLDFEDAPKVFSGKHFTNSDTRRDYGEPRKVTVGLLGDMVVVLVWTKRGTSHRIISMRKADRDERGEYYKQLD